MGHKAFKQLCQKLRRIGRVKDSTHSTVEEQVAKFLHIIEHNVKTRTMSFFFNCSEKTISRHFHNVLHASCHFYNVLHAILSLEEEFFNHLVRIFLMKSLIMVRIGAIDGTYSRLKVPKEGTAFDSIILKDTLSKEYPLRIPEDL
ncbi:hypothetical protein HN51_059588, partial [Arachis hypogaea]